ncbi:N-acetylmuramoyl-L-alanine amidase [Erwinia sp.]|uniref:N-acetylmuramoyl-L-alanine amidase n=1 Tax=Erwinia citreus TaxID=558 RepID=UPI0028A176A1|nr:N-acetylmuramoyl-L-alanine amidase [Erwinia sp.]
MKYHMPGKKSLAVAALTIVVLTGCASSGSSTSSSALQTALTDRGDYYADNTTSAVSQNSRVKFVIVHYTAENEENSFNTLAKGNKVSAHYLVAEHPKMLGHKPVITQLVSENRRAWHAGKSSWQGRNHINDSSLGIEIVNKGFTEKNGVRQWYPYTEAQINALALLLKDIIKRHEIEPNYVLGHSDIAPLRKQDPGKLFPWHRLAEQGIGAWPDAATVNKYLAGRSHFAPADLLSLQQALYQYGYDKIALTGVLDEETQMTISAFQMHFRPTNISGKADAETEAIAKALVEKYLTP